MPKKSAGSFSLYVLYPAYASGTCVYRKRVVLTPWGPRARLVPVCY